MRNLMLSGLLVFAAAQTLADERPVQVVFTPAAAPARANELPAQAVSCQPVTVRADVLAGLQATDVIYVDTGPGLGLYGEVVQVVRRGPQRYTVTGRVQDDPLSWFAIVVEDDGVAGQIEAPSLQQTFRLTYLGDRVHAMVEIDPRLYGRCDNEDVPGTSVGGVAIEEEPAVEAAWDQPVPDVGDAACTPGQPVYDVLILYTALARQAAGGTSQINAECQLAIDTANQGYVNSSIDARFRLVYRGEVSYNESGTYVNHVDRLTDPGDNVLDNAHTLRSSYKADFVSLWLADDDGGTICGRANCGGGASEAFSVVNWSCAAGNFSFHHEIGHNQGCDHNREDSASGCHADDWSYGWRWFGNSGNGWRTIMAYNNSASDYMRINYFSNPNVSFDGQPTGRPTGSSNESYNAKTIRDRRSTHEAFRNSGFDVWVDFAWNGAENGTYIFPFDTIAEAHNAIVVGVGASEPPVLHLKAGTTLETPTLSKPMIVTSCNGTARIGG